MQEVVVVLRLSLSTSDDDNVCQLLLRGGLGKLILRCVLILLVGALLGPATKAAVVDWLSKGSQVVGIAVLKGVLSTSKNGGCEFSSSGRGAFQVLSRKVGIDCGCGIGVAGVGGSVVTLRGDSG